MEVSPWPLFASISALAITFGGVYWWHYNSAFILLIGLLLNFLISFCWFGDVIKENMGGFHNTVVMFGFRFGMILFILSEVMFFFSFFWSYFNNCWGPTAEIGYIWPPVGFNNIVIDPFSIPLLNTVVLLSSGASVTWAHHALVSQDYDQAFIGLLLTVSLGAYFLFLQGNEYFLSCFSINSTVYGTVFFMLTGFHGFHVTIGTIILLVCFFRHFFVHFSSNQHVGFEAAAWYWHFVDVVWLFLYFFVYWYGYNL
uniref:Cytochrome c oxidase subunit 3 n=1 Tax=Planocera reticulata TaxID=6168 RepID=A0A343D2E3_9PLAT|nr:cytochrome c oxidase subunit III [Planocera reticulata]ARS43751.1 cytochrome c oxidase subunit III [Planocera reticulata]